MEYLAHYGVKGMKWGKRKAKGQQYLDAKRAELIKAGQTQAGLLKGGGSALKYETTRDKHNLEKLGVKQQQNANLYSNYKRSAKQAGRDAIRSLKNRDFKKALSYGKSTVDSYMRAYNAKKEYNKNAKYRDTEVTYGTAGNQSNIVRRYGDGTTVRLKKKGIYKR